MNASHWKAGNDGSGMFAARLLVMAVGMYLSSTPVQAQWQHTRWGMTLDEVRSSSPTTVIVEDLPRESTPTSRARARSTFQDGTLSFETTFRFDSEQRLNSVALSLIKRSDCMLLLGRLLNRYGDPTRRSRAFGTYMAGWTRAGGNVARLQISGDGENPSVCHLDYWPMGTSLTRLLPSFAR